VSLDPAPRLDHHLHPVYSGRLVLVRCPDGLSAYVLVQCQGGVSTVSLDQTPRLTMTSTRSKAA
jgi:hypothetical protein